MWRGAAAILTRSDASSVPRAGRAPSEIKSALTAHWEQVRLGSLDSAQQFHWHGRADEMVKVRGQRDFVLLPRLPRGEIGKLLRRRLPPPPRARGYGVP